MPDDIEDGVVQQKLAFWVQQLQNLPQLALPTDYPRPAKQNVVHAMKSLSLAPAAAKALARLALFEDEGQASSTSRFDDEADSVPDKEMRFYDLLVAAYAVLIHRWTGDTDVIVASSDPESGNALVLRIKLEPTDSFWQVAKRVQAIEMEALRNSVPYNLLEERLEAERVKAEGGSSGGPRNPIFRVRFFDDTGSDSRQFMQQTNLTTDISLFVTPLDVNVDPEAGVVRNVPQSSSTAQGHAPFRNPSHQPVALHIAYNALLFSAQRVEGILEQLSTLLCAAAKDPFASVGKIQFRTAAEVSLLPDPKKDLDWCGYKGSIVSIFERNAQAFPDRRCLVESVSTDGELQAPASKLRELSYGSLNRLSNVVAHRLRMAGIDRGDVVTVYAYRGIDLVIAVLATLKAGATFSVIDPSYPPSRQNIYLQVARPRALVVLAKAGAIHPQVRACIEEELNLKIEIPALQLAGSEVIGGDVNGEDVLACTQHRANQSTNVLLGPDSVATLSFTSGSTGIPKGVQGRHYSLTHFFPWMGERFQLSDKDRFTMLSGIAHDPIQRDIFTPLFFGAELHIPTAEDIGTSGRLAEWMAATQASVTHLTPAMGQLLSAQATAPISSLRNAFFVGDILTKRDCTRLQALAANVRIINMYGTTETQRAVSYYAIPSANEDIAFLKMQKDIMPAGEGMIDVQLLVVNRNERQQTCAVGEIGEIYVRSGGLAEGYLGPPEVTAEKFVKNWLAPDLEIPDTLKGSPEGQYWKGPRDRMYRTGDLGRYLPNGKVECTGRADDQIKIRGFRIELGEIDTHLSRHSNVRENVTLVRRDKDEEKVLVSYFVPNTDSPNDSAEVEVPDGIVGVQRDILSGIARHRGLIKEIRDYLKQKLPTYSVPTLFVPLAKMPLNPNGKIDKPALPFPDTVLAQRLAHASSSAAATQKPQTKTEQAIGSVWAELLPGVSEPVPLNESFFDLGGHSILATRLVFALRQTFAVHIPLGVVFDAPTVKTLASAIDSLRSGEVALSSIPTKDDQKIQETDYAQDEKKLEQDLPSKYGTPQSTQTILLTGATGFLGAFVLSDLLRNRKEIKKVYAHVRAKNLDAAHQRLQDSLQSRGLWDQSWIETNRLEAVLGDLAEPQLGIDDASYARLRDEVDAIIHNGALVHWVYPYSKLRAANVLSTLATISLAADSRPKSLTLISSTSALDTDHYVRLSDTIQATPNSDLRGISEEDDLQGSATGLTTGYGQSKWVSERLVMAAAARGLKASIVRPGYIVGDSRSAVTNTDDFLFRLVKGSVQLGLIPDMDNTVNMVPVDHVARITSLVALAAPSNTTAAPTFGPVFHVTSHPSIRYSQFLSALAHYGWNVDRCEYVEWRAQLENHVLSTANTNEEANALFPLLHFVLDDLPTSTKSAELDDRHTESLLVASNEHNVVKGVDEQLLGLYFAWLVAVGFLPKPTKSDSRCAPLPELADHTVKQAVGRMSANTN
ncbi:L-2-aminoadipate reductase [Malassezia yamatoensis]|uniref:Alpha-aminoadipate reductase n=1 Tax=Malassezia yamatoensis TaxID=253288 RepID=A0AAJ6CHC8_9BASI|nr:L-2-aminoadipate reductase [Malassezia yamatoensis]